MRSSQLKWSGTLMETVTDARTGKSAEIRFDKKRGQFFCIIGEDNMQVIVENMTASRLLLRKLLIHKDAISNLQQVADGTKPLLLTAGK